MKDKLISLIIASVITLNGLPTNIFQKDIYAASYESNIGKIENPVPGGDNDNWSGNYIYFGHYPQNLKENATKNSTDINNFEIEPIKWRVLDNNNKAWTGDSDRSKAQANGFAYNIGAVNNSADTTKGGRQNAPVDGDGMLLYSDVALDAKQYHPTIEGNDEENKLCWGGVGNEKGCTLWAWLNGYNNSSVLSNSTVPDLPFLTNAFTSAEQNAILQTKVYSEDVNSTRGLANSQRTSLSEDKIFVLSYNEMLNASYGFTNAIDISNTRKFAFSSYSNNLKQYTRSWLRSPGDDPSSAHAAGLYSHGNVSNDLHIGRTLGVCPAFNLNPPSVVLVSNANDSSNGGKSMTVSLTPMEFSLPTGRGNEYKLTLCDENRKFFFVSKTLQNENEIIISYSGAKTGEKEYISCLILDDQSEIKYYGKLKQVDAESGEATLILPEEFEVGDTVSVVIFNEQCNGDKETDCSSKPIVFEVTVGEKSTENESNNLDETENESNNLDKPKEQISFLYRESNEIDQRSKSQTKSFEKIIFAAKSKKESVEIFDGETKKIRYDDKVTNITLKKSDNILKVEIKDENGNDLDVSGKINLVFSCEPCESGTVAAIIKPDGTIKVIRKSVAKDGKIYLPLDGSVKLEILDNGKNFYDVPKNYWAYDTIKFASAHELFNGAAPNIFEPETPMSRAMMVQVLYNLEDNPSQVFEKIFSDVNVGDWFAEAVTWGATHRGTIIGYDDGRFGPNDKITREQLATILYRYFGENESVDANLNFVDANEISDYAKKSLSWAIANKIVQGKGNNVLDPKGFATRAQVAQMFQNLMLNLFYK